jgi:endonuclease/exonuclease/phosphatase family metal-dependent hydrolase
VVSYNVRDLLDDRAATARVVKACRPDVLCLQEAPRRPGTLCRTTRLVRDTGLRPVVGGRESGGTAVLVAPGIEVLAADAVRLPVAHLWTRRRGFAMARVRLPDGAQLTVASVHLPLGSDDRLEHVRLVCSGLTELATAAVVVCGDLNEPPGGPSWMALGPLVRDPVSNRPTDGAVSDSPTYPAKAPRHRIDGVLVSEAVRVVALRPAGDPEGLRREDLVAASDHLPLVADLELAKMCAG